MPYRTDLKRPDLKGQFPCSVCGKVFCHSSSLSRHRMQAHFKSYTCTQCNQEISSNETLRSHMYRFHQISRMFMCRCCNWAFPDKTSLHIHMQSMIKNGKPGDVAVLARSSVEGDPMLANMVDIEHLEINNMLEENSPKSSPGVDMMRDSTSPVSTNSTPHMNASQPRHYRNYNHRKQADNAAAAAAAAAASSLSPFLNGNALAGNNNQQQQGSNSSSIFPPTMVQLELLNKLKGKNSMMVNLEGQEELNLNNNTPNNNNNKNNESSTMGSPQNQWLVNWLVNNPYQIGASPQQQPMPSNEAIPNPLLVAAMATLRNNMNANPSAVFGRMLGGNNQGTSQYLPTNKKSKLTGNRSKQSGVKKELGDTGDESANGENFEHLRISVPRKNNSPNSTEEINDNSPSASSGSHGTGGGCGKQLSSVINNLLLVKSGRARVDDSSIFNDSFTGSDGGRRNKRKARVPQQLTSDVKREVEEEKIKMETDPPTTTTTAAGHLEPEQPSPAVSDSQTSGSSAHLDVNTSPKKCAHCQAMKNKLEYTESRIQQFQERIAELEAKLAKTDGEEDDSKSPIDESSPPPSSNEEECEHNSKTVLEEHIDEPLEDATITS